jgi:hypothetical protein
MIFDHYPMQENIAWDLDEAAFFLNTKPDS